MTAVCTYIQR